MLQPIIDVESIGTGGGTIARVDPDTGGLLVGPKSAGATPCPVCYDQGGDEVTVTDADLVLGILDPGYFLGGRKVLNREKARDRIRDRIARPLQELVSSGTTRWQTWQESENALPRRQSYYIYVFPTSSVLSSFRGSPPRT